MIQISITLLFSFWMLLTFPTQAQDLVLRKSSVSNAGHCYTNGTENLLISQTIGQPSLISHFQNGSTHLFQGFEYSFNNPNELSSVEVSSVALYPNPSNGKMVMKWKSMEISEMIFVEIFDLNGKKIRDQSVERKGSIARVDLKELEDGIYLMETFGIESGLTSRLIIIQE